MIRMKYSFLGILSCALSGIAAASPTSTSGILNYVGTGLAGEGLYVGINQSLSSGCAGPYVFIATSAPQYKETVSTVLLASAQGKTITLYYDNAAACTSNGSIVLMAVSIGP
jgi:hypothetical protein